MPCVALRVDFYQSFKLMELVQYSGDWFWSAVAYRMVNEASSSSLTCAFTRYHCSIQSMQTAVANCPTVLVHIRPSEKQRNCSESGKGLAQAPSHYKQCHAQVVLWETDGIRHSN